MVAGETAVSCPFCRWKGNRLQLERCMYKYAAVYTFYLINMKEIKSFYVRLENVYSNSSQYMLRNQYYMKLLNSTYSS